jgi:hypothetical protein
VGSLSATRPLTRDIEMTHVIVSAVHDHIIGGKEGQASSKGFG